MKQGRNGKSVFGNILKNMMGPFYQAGDDSILFKQGNKSSGSATPELMNLMDARLVVIPETEKSHRFNIKRVKSLTGGDMVTGRALYCDQISFKLTCKFIVMTNEKPPIDVNDSASIDRLKPIPFLAKFDNNPANCKYVKWLESQQDQFFTLAVKGAVKWYQSEFGLPSIKCINKFKQDYIEENDDIGLYLQECKENKTMQIYSKVAVSEIYNCEPTRKQLMDFNKVMIKRGYKKDKNMNGTYFVI